MASYIVYRSSLIDTLDEAREYYGARLVREHQIECRGVSLLVRFNPEETHLFSEEMRPGTKADPAKLVHRAGPGGETRYFSRARARLLDEILPTICAPVTSLEAKIARGQMLIGPPTLEASQRLVVVVAPDRERLAYFVRTAYPISQAQFAIAVRSRRVRWPPK